MCQNYNTCIAETLESILVIALQSFINMIYPLQTTSAAIGERFRYIVVLLKTTEVSKNLPGSVFMLIHLFSWSFG